MAPEMCEHSPFIIDDPLNWGKKTPIPTLVTISGLMPLVPENYTVSQHPLLSRGSFTLVGSQVATDLQHSSDLECLIEILF